MIPPLDGHDDWKLESGLDDCVTDACDFCGQTASVISLMNACDSCLELHQCHKCNGVFGTDELWVVEDKLLCKECDECSTKPTTKPQLTAILEAMSSLFSSKNTGDTS